MKARMFRSLGLIGVVLLFTLRSENMIDIRACAQTAGNQSKCNPVFPPFLETGKTYSFYVALPDNAVTGKVEKIDVNSGWVYVNYLIYVAIPNKKREYERKYEGYGWVNMNLVYGCTEIVVTK
jgi:hypothetical protein